VKQAAFWNGRALVFNGVISMEKTMKWVEAQLASKPRASRVLAVSVKEETIAVTGRGAVPRAPLPPSTLGGSLTVRISRIPRRSRRLTA